MRFRAEEMLLETDSNSSIIITSHHDGDLREINGVELPRFRDLGNDKGTRSFTLRLMKSCLSIDDVFVAPKFVIYRVAKARSSEEMFFGYLDYLRNLVCQTLVKQGKCLVIDIHCFYKYPELVGEIDRRYDLWFGTNNRQTIIDDFDRCFANALQEEFFYLTGRGLEIYVPKSYEREGERFGAKGKDTSRRIQTKWLKEEAPNCETLQVEIYRELLLGNKQTVNLVEAFRRALHIKIS